MDAEFGRPQWRFGLSTYAFCDAYRIVCAFRKRDRAPARPVGAFGPGVGRVPDHGGEGAYTRYYPPHNPGVPTAYLAFEGEGHGFRRAETIRRCLEAELDFYSRVLGFAPADVLEPAPIQNL